MCAKRPRPTAIFIDDIAVITDEHWCDAGRQLLEAVSERPAVTCVPVEHHARRAASRDAGLRIVSYSWIRPTSGAGPSTVEPLPTGSDLTEPPPHTFGGRLDPWHDGALSFVAAGSGIVTGSRSVNAPPVYDPGGTVATIDRLIGDRPALVRTALACAGRRGDVLACVVCADGDDNLAVVLERARFQRVVEVWTWG
ncbi:MAG TPA: hypothetical protein VIB48_03055 [Acidimicrobiia bacterium]|jgi:hypothetical protein